MLADSFDEGNKDQPELAIKTLVIGDSRVGKTSLLLKYVDKSFPDEHISTIGVEYKEKLITKDGFNIRLQIWDTAGEERFRSITKSIYKNTHGVLFVYDITQKDTFANVKHWIKDTENIDREIRGVIVGNKIDLDEIGEKYKMPVIETSAKEGTNVNECFELLIDELFKNKTHDQIKEIYLRKAKSDLSISSKTINTNKKKKCC